MRRLAPLISSHIPPELTQEIQAWMIVLGSIGVIVAFFLPTDTAVRVINIVSMITLVVAGIAGLDATRRNVKEDGL